MSTKQSQPITKNPLYKVWVSMRARCKYPSCDNYPRYGGRGIRVCDEWDNSSTAFIEWAEANGYQPGLFIDRINNDEGYSPRNCRFVDRFESARNKRPVPRKPAAKKAPGPHGAWISALCECGCGKILKSYEHQRKRGAGKFASRACTARFYAQRQQRSGNGQYENENGKPPSKLI